MKEPKQTLDEQVMMNKRRRQSNNGAIAGYTPKQLIMSNNQIKQIQTQMNNESRVTSDYIDSQRITPELPQELIQNESTLGYSNSPAFQNQDVIDQIYQQSRSPYGLMNPTDMNRDINYSRETNLNSNGDRINEPHIHGGKNLLINYFDDSISQNSMLS